ncbi:MAG: 16S rRNA (adenine(1518)-N(6)/adenine(1519)-N(6))-dimethyltransferase RsmA [candidate division Zixibacteria bacterium]|nr:16S rRNA (adenine(1518)-N(6)/adenine(1519)-N(6))-dimethyltransferase RsmA [candidate division Zixibacteria bacterium]
MSRYHPKKRLGQNFLKSDEIIRRIVDLVNPRSGQVLVEIGPGQGALTLPLARSGATIVAVEIDNDLIGYLEKSLGQYENVRIVNQDFLLFDPVETGIDKFTLVGNLPYHISSPVMEWIAKRSRMLEQVFLMVQKEVAERLCSSPGSKGWSPLSIFTQLLFDVTNCFTVRPVHFHPRPKVSSTVIKLTPKEELEIRYRTEFERVVRYSFRQRRKLLKNNLVPEIITDTDTALEYFAKVDLPSNTRAEQVTTEHFLKLTDLLVSERYLRNVD